MTIWASAALVASGVVAAVIGIVALILAFGWGIAVLVMGAADDEPYDYEPLHVIRED